MADAARDRVLIQEMTSHYARAVDYCEIDGMDDLFTEDCRVLGVGNAGPIEGLSAWKAWLRNALERFGATQHFFGNHFIIVEDDEASMRSSLQATHVIKADPKETLVLLATYYDELVRTPDGWRIREHRLEPQHIETRRAV